MTIQKNIEKILKSNNGYLKTSELKEYKLNKMLLKRFMKTGEIERISRGLYISKDTIEDDYYVLQYRCPKAIFSHETALYFHDLTDRTPDTLMITIPTGYNSRLLKDEHYVFSYIKPELHNLGKMKIKTPFGNEVYCYDIDRTICDIIRHKDKIERYQFVDALKRYSRMKNKDISKLYKYAEKLHIQKKVREYMEILL